MDSDWFMQQLMLGGASAVEVHIIGTHTDFNEQECKCTTVYAETHLD